MPPEHILILLTAIALVAFIIAVVVWALKKNEQENEKMTSLAEAIVIWNPDDRYEPLSKQLNLGKAKPADTLKKKAENAFIASLPLSTACNDNYTDCPKWAADGECTINPEYMLYNCAKSCQACALNEQQKYDLVKIYNTRDPAHCVYHDEDYPSTTRFMYQLHNL
jgi:nitrogen fixation-related uncharacterized protein